MTWINVYETPDGPHYSRPHETREAALSGGRWLERYSHTEAKKLHPHRFVQTVRVILKDESHAESMCGGKTMCGEYMTRRGTGRRHESNPPNVPEGYIRATDLNVSKGRCWWRYWANKNAKEYAKAVSRDVGIPVQDLVHSIVGGVTTEQGTWIHERIAEHFRAWLTVTAWEGSGK